MKKNTLTRYTRARVHHVELFGWVKGIQYMMIIIKERTVVLSEPIKK